MGPVLVLGGLVTGVIAQAVVATGGRYDDVLFSGQFAVGDLVTDPDLRMVALVTAAKALAYAVCLGAGFRGGPVFPAIFVGTGVAVLLGSVVGMSPTVAVAIGAACGMAAFTRLIVTSLVFAALLVGVAGTAALPASVLAAVTAWLGVTVVESRRPAPPLPGH
jgi:H+/Cl- antiporter ClcA